MTNNSPRVRSLLRQADKVAVAGKRAAAEKLYREILVEEPETAEAWAGLADVVQSEEERASSFRRALEIDPDNEAARLGLGLSRAETGNHDPDITAGSEITNSEGEYAGVDADSLQTVSPTTIAEQDIEPVGAGTVAAEEHDHQAMADSFDDLVFYCANHPSRQTYLRCNRCGKPICSTCAKPTPVGYRCPECIREQEDIFFSATLLDYLLVIIVTIPLSLIGGWLATRLGFFTIFLGAAAGSFIGRITFWVARRHRGRWMPQLVGVLVVIGGLLPAVPYILAILFGRFSLDIIWIGIYIIAASGSAYYQMK